MHIKYSIGRGSLIKPHGFNNIFLKKDAGEYLGNGCSNCYPVPGDSDFSRERVQQGICPHTNPRHSHSHRDWPLSRPGPWSDIPDRVWHCRSPFCHGYSRSDPVRRWAPLENGNNSIGIPRTIELTLISFVVTMLVSAGILVFLHLLELLPALMLGAAIGGTSSAVVIPMIEHLHLGKDSQAILALESAITECALYRFTPDTARYLYYRGAECSLCCITARFIVLCRGDSWCFRWDRMVSDVSPAQNDKNHLISDIQRANT